MWTVVRATSGAANPAFEIDGGHREAGERRTRCDDQAAAARRAATAGVECRMNCALHDRQSRTYKDTHAEMRCQVDLRDRALADSSIARAGRAEMLGCRQPATCRPDQGRRKPIRRERSGRRTRGFRGRSVARPPRLALRVAGRATVMTPCGRQTLEGDPAIRQAHGRIVMPVDIAAQPGGSRSPRPSMARAASRIG